LQTSVSIPEGLILVIDDEPAIVEMVTRLLRLKGYTVVGAERASAALDILQQQPCAAILCDVRMPDMDGIAFYHWLQSADLPQRPRLIVMTGDTSSPGTEDFLRQHKLPVLRKPFTWQELLAALEPPD